MRKKATVAFIATVALAWAMHAQPTDASPSNWLRGRIVCPHAIQEDDLPHIHLVSYTPTQYVQFVYRCNKTHK